MKMSFEVVDGGSYCLDGHDPLDHSDHWVPPRSLQSHQPQSCSSTSRSYSWLGAGEDLPTVMLSCRRG